MKNYLEYKGYIATVEFNSDDSIFFGKLQGINDLVTFEGSSVKELKSAFHESVTDYLKTCLALNKTPEKNFKGSFNVRVSKELHQKTALLASKNGLNLNDVVKVALSYIVGHEEVLSKELLMQE